VPTFADIDVCPKRNIYVSMLYLFAVFTNDFKLILGTVPPGIPVSFYPLVAKLKPENHTILLDATNIECLMTGRVDILKINGAEARSLVNDR
jgi:fructose-1-phosphate kinase PfkB-like protein